jgi:transposase-like protein
MREESLDVVQRWTAKRRVDLVVSLLTGETSVAEAARKHGLTIAEIEAWRGAFLLGAENALRTRPRDEEALKDAEIQRLQRKVGELVMDKDILTAAMKLKNIPFGKGTSESS